MRKVCMVWLAVAVTIGCCGSVFGAAEIAIIEWGDAEMVNDGGGWPNGWSASTGKSTAEGCDGTATVFNSSYANGGSGTWFEVTPNLLSTHDDGGTNLYDVFVTVPNSSSIAGMLSNIVVSGGSGLPASTDAFGPQSIDVWTHIGQLALDPGVNQPVIRFEETAHEFSGSGTTGRFYADAIKFERVPEPASLALLAIGGLFLARRRRTV